MRSIWEFDEFFTAPRNGFAGADDYYARNAARNFLGAIAVPTLVIHALDDPWVPSEPYRDVRLERQPSPRAAACRSAAGISASRAATGARPGTTLAIAQFFAAVLSRP